MRRRRDGQLDRSPGATAPGVHMHGVGCEGAGGALDSAMNATQSAPAQTSAFVRSARHRPASALATIRSSGATSPLADSRAETAARRIWPTPMQRPSSPAAGALPGGDGHCTRVWAIPQVQRCRGPTISRRALCGRALVRPWPSPRRDRSGWVLARGNHALAQASCAVGSCESASHADPPPG